MYSIRELILLVVLIAVIELSESTTLQSRSAVEGAAQYAERGEFTYLAVITSYSNYGGCTGTLLSDRWVITSATCMEYASIENTLILVGAVTINEGDIYICDAIKTHENYDSATNENNIAALRSDRPILFTQYVQPIPYFKGQSEPCKTTIVGYKEVHNSMFQSGNYWIYYMNVSKVSNRECQSLWLNTGRPEVTFATNICVLASVEDPESYYQSPICYSRGGESLVASDSRVLLGLKATMYDCTNTTPFLFTDVSQFSDWIEATTNVAGVDVL